MPAIAILVCFAAYCFSLTAATFVGFIGFFIFGYFVFMMPQGPTLSLMQDALKPGERALGVSFALFVNNIMGQVVGLFVVGFLSDKMAPTFGVTSLNYAILILSAIAAVLGCMTYMWTASAMTGSRWQADPEPTRTLADGVKENG